MRRFSLFFILFLLFCTVCSATEENFYLTTRTAPKKLIPSDLACTLQKGESKTVAVDPIPKDADVSKITWSLSSDISIAAITWEGRSCTIHALTEGSGILIARDESGAACEIKVNVLDSILQSLHLQSSSDTVQTGETALIHAVSEPANAEIVWTVEENGTSAVSYGGAICKINAQNEGNVHVRASIAGSNIYSDYTLHIKPAPETISPVFDSILRFLLYGSGALLLFSLILFLFYQRRRFH